MPDHAEEDELTLIENAPPSRPDARLGVPATAALLVAAVVGTGVLALPRNARAVGLPFGLAFLAAQVPLNQRAGAMLDRAAASAEARGAPLADYRELSVALAGRGSALARATALAFYANLALILANYLVAASGAVQVRERSLSPRNVPSLSV